MADIESIAMVLSKSSKTVADWKVKFPSLQNTMKLKLSSEMDKVSLLSPSMFIFENVKQNITDGASGLKNLVGSLQCL